LIEDHKKKSSPQKTFESAREQIPRGLPRVSDQKWNCFFLLRIEDSPQLAAESFNFEHPFSQTESGKSGLAQNARISYYGIKQQKAAGLA
jgi:hypothetical protein